MFINQGVVRRFEVVLFLLPAYSEFLRFGMVFAAALVVAGGLVCNPVGIGHIVKWIELRVAAGFFIVTERAVPEPLATDKNRRSHFELHHASFERSRMLVPE